MHSLLVIASPPAPPHLMPQELHRAAKGEQLDALEDLGLFDCIECGCCDVVCPSHIRLTESFRAAKQGFVQSMDLQARVRWFRARVSSYGTSGSSTGKQSMTKAPGKSDRRDNAPMPWRKLSIG